LALVDCGERSGRRHECQRGTLKRAPHMVLVLLLLVAFLPVTAAPKKKPALDTYAVVSGSIFDGSGYAFPDADVTLAPGAESGSASAKTKPMEAVSDARGEFVFRVPPGPMNYTVTVSAKGYQSQRKSVSIQDQERVEVTFQMERESK
jgi:Carboxypeptidase regulatory-like domain